MASARGDHGAPNRVTAAAVCGGVDVPGFDNSAMDGVAVRAEEVRGATATETVKL